MKNLLNLGKALNTNEQKQINGGNGNECWECLPSVPNGHPLGCTGSEICQVMSDGCNFCV